MKRKAIKALKDESSDSLERLTVEKEQITANNQSYPKDLTFGRVYKDEVKQSVEESMKPLESNSVDKSSLDPNCVDSKSVEKSLVSNETNAQKTRKNDLNAQKCIFSPFAYHRWTRSHKEKLPDKTISLIMRCRYCKEMQQTIISFEMKDGRWIATKEVIGVPDK